MTVTQQDGAYVQDIFGTAGVGGFADKEGVASSYRIVGSQVTQTANGPVRHGMIAVTDPSLAGVTEQTPFPVKVMNQSPSSSDTSSSVASGTVFSALTGQIVSGIASRPGAYLWNPKDSGKMLTIRGIKYGLNTALPFVSIRSINAVPGSAFLGATWKDIKSANRNMASTNTSVAKAGYTENVTVDLSALGTIVDMGSPFNGQIFPNSDALAVPPGSGILWTCDILVPSTWFCGMTWSEA